MSAWMKAIVSIVLGFESESSLVRMFRIEYNREYEHLRQGGYRIDEDYVRRFLFDGKKSAKA